MSLDFLDRPNVGSNDAEIGIPADTDDHQGRPLVDSQASMDSAAGAHRESNLAPPDEPFDALSRLRAEGCNDHILAPRHPFE